MEYEHSHEWESGQCAICLCPRINWRIGRIANNPVEIYDRDTGKVIVRVYDWEGDGDELNGLQTREQMLGLKALRRKRKLNALRKAGMIILAMKMLAMER